MCNLQGANVKSKVLCISLVSVLFVLFLLFNISQAQADVIIDNGGAGTSYTGEWSLSAGANPYGTSSLWSRNGATYNFTMAGQPAGTYEVRMWWSGLSTRSQTVPVTISYTGGTKNVTVNQRQNAGQWNSLGSFYFKGSGSVTITAAEGESISTCADAVEFRLVSSNEPPVATIDSITPSAPDPGTKVTFTGHGTGSNIIGYEWSSSIDGIISTEATFSTTNLSPGTHTISFKVKNADGTISDAATREVTVGGTPTAAQTPSTTSTAPAGASTQPDAAATLAATAAATEVIIDNTSSNTSRTGTWTPSSSSGYYGTGSIWARDGATFTWKFTPSQTGTYDVSMWWTTAASRSSSIPVTIQYSGGSKVVTINQLQNAGKWNSLGKYTFTAGTTYTVVITAQAAPTSTCADAVKFTYTGTATTGDTIIDNTSSNTSRTGTWTPSSSSGYYGTGSIWARDGATFTWKFTPSSSGYYQVFMWWTTSLHAKFVNTG